MERKLGLALLGAAALAALAARASVPPEERRLAYSPTLLDAIEGIARDPLQLGVLAGAAAGALGAALAGAAAQHARRRPRPSDGLRIG